MWTIVGIQIAGTHFIVISVLTKFVLLPFGTYTIIIVLWSITWTILDTDYFNFTYVKDTFF